MKQACFIIFQDSQNRSLLLAALSIFIAWIIYRLGVWTERKSILDSISKEVDLHKDWVNKEYFDGLKDPSWKKFKGYVVFRLSTVAIDNAIAKGPGVFLNNRLVTELVGYRQRIAQLNQLIECASSFQSNEGLWKKNASASIKDRMFELICQIHWYGISNNSKEFAYKYYQRVTYEIKRERDSKLVAFIWLISNINLFGLW